MLWKRRAGRLKRAGHQGGLGFSYLGMTAPELGMRRRALSSGLIARDKIACVTQAPSKGREAQHDSPGVMYSPQKVKCDISLA
jgi:hypothetical protein